MEAPHQISVTRPEQGSLLVRLSGSWKMQRGLPSTETVRRQLAAHPSLERVSFDTSDLSDWDSGLLVFLLSVLEGSRLVCVSDQSFLHRVARSATQPLNILRRQSSLYVVD